jgi:predicted component of type VI protein secretion system
MALTVVVLSGGLGGAADLSLTLDAPRVVVGRQRGGEYVLLDENSTNGTFMDRVRLPPQTPRALRSGERVRVGRVWIELRFEPAMVKGSTAAAAKELALSLVARGLRAQGEEPGPVVTVLEGPEQGRALVVAEVGKHYVIGRSKEADLALEDGDVARRHLSVSRKGEALAVTDLGSPSGFLLDDAHLGAGEASWRVGQVLQIGGTLLGFAYPAAEVLAELERSPDERMPDGEAPAPPAGAAAADETPPAEQTSLEATPTPAPASAGEIAPRSRRPPEPGGWGTVDSVVALLALAVLLLSVLGAFWLFGR